MRLLFTGGYKFWSLPLNGNKDAKRGAYYKASSSSLKNNFSTIIMATRSAITCLVVEFDYDVMGYCYNFTV